MEGSVAYSASVVMSWYGTPSITGSGKSCILDKCRVFCIYLGKVDIEAFLAIGIDVEFRSVILMDNLFSCRINLVDRIPDFILEEFGVINQDGKFVCVSLSPIMTVMYSCRNLSWLTWFFDLHKTPDRYHSCRT